MIEDVGLGPPPARYVAPKRAVQVLITVVPFGLLVAGAAYAGHAVWLGRALNWTHMGLWGLVFGVAIVVFGVLALLIFQRATGKVHECNLYNAHLDRQFDKKDIFTGAHKGHFLTRIGQARSSCNQARLDALRHQSAALKSAKFALVLFLLACLLQLVAYLKQ